MARCHSASPGVDDQRRSAVASLGQVPARPRAAHPVVAVPGSPSGRRAPRKCAPSRSPSSSRSPSGASAGATQRRPPVVAAGTGRRPAPAPGSPGRPTARASQASSVRSRRRSARGCGREGDVDGVRRGEAAPRQRALASRRLGSLGCAMSTHIGAEPGQIAPHVLMPGDPLRARWIAETFLDDATCYTEVRGMYGYTGTWQGRRSRCRARGWACRRSRSTSTSCSATYDVAGGHPGRLLRGADRGARAARHGDRLGRLHRLVDEPDPLRGPRLRPGRRLRAAAQGARRGPGPAGDAARRAVF